MASLLSLELSSKSLILVALTVTFVACRSSSQSAERDQPEAEYNRETGRLQRLAFDSDADGRNDAVGNLDGTHLNSIELDTNRNGKIDRWHFYDAERRLVRVGVSRQDDGVMDAIAVYGPDEQVLQLDVSTRRDGRFDRVEFYQSGLLSRAEEDTDADGRVDKWESYRRNPRSGSGEPPALVSMVAFDDASAGRPTRRLVYGPDGNLARVEHLHADGTFAASRAESR